MNKVSYLYSTTCKYAVMEVEKLARKILRDHPHLDEFVMAMGTFFFTDKKGNSIATWDSKLMPNYEYRTFDTRKYFKPLNDFITEWDPVLKITGEPMRFTATSPIKTNW